MHLIDVEHKEELHNTHCRHEGTEKCSNPAIKNNHFFNIYPINISGAPL